jgi:hypothetical protein
MMYGVWAVFCFIYLVKDLPDRHDQLSHVLRFNNANAPGHHEREQRQCHRHRQGHFHCHCIVSMPGNTKRTLNTNTHEHERRFQHHESKHQRQ